MYVCMIHVMSFNYRSTRDGTTWYLTKWKDLSYDQATWETEDSDIADFSAEIEKYLANRYVYNIIIPYESTQFQYKQGNCCYIYHAISPT